jgi:hypothetical protein
LRHAANVVKGFVTPIVVFSQPNDDDLCSRKDGHHQRDVSLFLFVAALVDTDGVDP